MAVLGLFVALASEVILVVDSDVAPVTLDTADSDFGRRASVVSPFYGIHG